MPSPKRWHPVNRDLNDDPEAWDFTDTFGDRSLRTWLEILAQLDRNDNSIPVSPAWLAGLARKCRQTRHHMVAQIDWMIEKGWIRARSADDSPPSRQPAASQPPVSGQSAADQRRMIREVLAGGPLVILMAVNFWKYHKKREASGAKQRPDKDPLLSYPNRSYPNLPYKKEKEGEDVSRRGGSPPGSREGWRQRDGKGLTPVAETVARIMKTHLQESVGGADPQDLDHREA